MKSDSPPSRTANRMLILFLWVAAGCANGDSHSSFTVRDSAGIRIIESQFAMWESDDQWSVSSEPTLSIGERDGEEALQFFRIRGVLRFEDGRIAALNGGSNTIRIFGPDGSLLTEFGGSGDGPGEFRSLGSAHILRADTLIIWDGRRPGFSFFTVSGQLIQSQTLTPPGTERLNGLELLSDGRLLLETYASPLTQDPGRSVGIHRDFAPLILMDREGAILDTVGMFPSAELGIVRIAGGLGMGLVPFGKNSWIDTRGNSILVGTAEDMEVSVFDPRGRLQSIFRVPEVELTLLEEDRDWFFEQLSKRAKTPEEGEMLEAVIEGMVFPEKKAAYSGMLVGPDGTVWLRTGLHFPPEGSSREWTVFSPEGALLGALQLPEGFEVFEFGSDYALGVWKDEMDVEFIHLYRLNK